MGRNYNVPLERLLLERLAFQASVARDELLEVSLLTMSLNK